MSSVGRIVKKSLKSLHLNSKGSSSPKTPNLASLKMRVGGSGRASQDQSERIRQLELEAARS